MRLKLLEENIGLSLCDLELGSDFLDITPKAQIRKEKKIDKLGFLKIKNFHVSKDTIKKVKRHPQNERKYLQYI